jgi:hypothetical protein
LLIGIVCDVVVVVVVVPGETRAINAAAASLFVATNNHTKNVNYVVPKIELTNKIKNKNRLD